MRVSQCDDGGDRDRDQGARIASTLSMQVVGQTHNAGLVAGGGGGRGGGGAGGGSGGGSV